LSEAESGRAQPGKKCGACNLRVRVFGTRHFIVLHYGLYSNASRQRRAKGDDEELLIPDADCSACDESKWNKSRP
jgi:hypothetical protein